MTWKHLVSQTTIMIALIVDLAAMTTIVIVSGSSSLEPTRLPEVAIALAGALAGVTMQKNGGTG